MKKTDGPLSSRQERILEHLMEGKRHKQISMRMGLGVSTLKQEIMAITRKMKVGTSQEAVSTYATARAYAAAAVQVRSGKVWSPICETDEHVNHVLDGIADLLADWANQRFPK